MIENKTRLITHQRLGLHLFVGLLVVVVGTVLFSVLAHNIVTNSSLVQLDQNISLTLHAWATPGVTPIFIFFSLIGFEILWVVVIVLTIYFAVQRRWARLITWIAAFAGGELLNELLKRLFARPRPVWTDPLQTAANFSFPSGHAMFSTIVYGMFAYFVLLGVRRRSGRVAIITATILLVLLIGFSRIYLGVHYFSDVAGGFAMGAIWLSVCITGLEEARAYRYRRGLESPTTELHP